MLDGRRCEGMGVEERAEELQKRFGAPEEGNRLHDFAELRLVCGMGGIYNELVDCVLGETLFGERIAEDCRSQWTIAAQRLAEDRQKLSLGLEGADAG